MADDASWNGGYTTGRATPASRLPEGTDLVVNERGIYGWRATIDMRENPTVALLLAKVAGLTCAVLLAVLVGTALTSKLESATLLMALGIILGVCAFTALLFFVGYLVYRAALGGTFSADYLMDETGLLFQPAPKEEELSRRVATGATVIGALTGNYGVAAAGIAAIDSSSVSHFASVFRVKGVRRHGVIKVSEPLLYNQVYVAPQDYDFVYRFICDHCPKARCVER